MHGILSSLGSRASAARRCAAWALLAALAAGGCKQDEKKAGLVVAIQTDMSVPKDVDSVTIEISAYGKILFSRDYPVGKNGVLLPATLTLLPPEDAATPVTIRVVSWKKKEPRTLRRVVTTVPSDREALLRMPIEWLCDGQVDEDGKTVSSSCKEEGSSCLTGTCTADEIDSKDLPGFFESRIFGGGTADGKGTCFDTSPCFAENTPSSEFGLDLDSCSFELERAGALGNGGATSGELDVSKLNFALVSGSGEGICGDWGCFIPLDRHDETGWRLEGETVTLPPAVCARLQASASVKLVASSACDTKTTETPTCGPWSTVSGNTITVVDINDLPPPITSTGGSDGTGGGDGTGGSSPEPSGGTGGMVSTGGTDGTGGGSGGASGGSGGTGGQPAADRCAEVTQLAGEGSHGFDTGLSTLNNPNYGSLCSATANGLDKTFALSLSPGQRVNANASTGMLFTSLDCANVGGTCISDVNSTFAILYENISAAPVTLYFTVDSTAASHEGVLNVTVSECGDGNVDAFSPEICDDGNQVSGDGCSSTCQTVEAGWTCPSAGGPCGLCGDGLVSGMETCDDGNGINGDGCSSSCAVEPGYGCPGAGGPCHLTVCGDGFTDPPTEVCDDQNATTGDGCHQCQHVTAIAAGGYQSCMVDSAGKVKCWGLNNFGQLGQGDDQARGDEAGEMASLSPIDLGTNKRAVHVAVGDGFACAVFDDTSVKCWGANTYGQLGLGDSGHRGLSVSDMGDNLPAVALGSFAAYTIDAGAQHACAMGTGGIKCWGENSSGQLGLSDKASRGTSASEMGNNLPLVDLGAVGSVMKVVTGHMHTCALIGPDVKCWGDNSSGQLGLGDTEARGDDPDEMGDDLPFVDLGAGRQAWDIAAGDFHTCALLDNSSIKCWGDNGQGQLGLGDTSDRGDNDNEMGDYLPFVAVDDTHHAIAVFAAGNHTCARLDDDSLKCWGMNAFGQLGQGDTLARGSLASHLGSNLAPIWLGTARTALSVAAGAEHTCALLDNRTVKCWGYGFLGQLGQGSNQPLGDQSNELGDFLSPILVP